MDSAKILGIMCKSCRHIVSLKDKNHTCSIGQPQYSFERSIIPKQTESSTNDSSVDMENEDDDSEFYIRLIDAVHQRQPLWDHRVPWSSHYEHIKQKLWDEKYVELYGAFPIVTLKKKKWKYLRKKFVHGKRKPASEAGGVKKKFVPHESFAVFK